LAIFREISRLPFSLLVSVFLLRAGRRVAASVGLLNPAFSRACLNLSFGSSIRTFWPKNIVHSVRFGLVFDQYVMYELNYEHAQIHFRTHRRVADHR